jgi:hypothetical protein
MPTAELNLQVEGAAAPSGAAGATATAAPGGSASPPKPWYDGKLDAELIGYSDNKHWNKDDPMALAIEAMKSSRELHKHFGVAEDRLVKLPKDINDEAGWNGVYQRLGAPKEAKEYDLSAIKFSDGSELKDLPGFEDAMRASLYAAHVSKDKAADIVKSVVKFMDGAEQTMGAATQAQKLENLQTLQKNWGHNFELNRLTALQGARRLGISMDGLAALESAIGYPNVMEVMRKIGVGTTEDTFVEGAQTGHPTTQQGAVARRAELMKDQDFVNRYLRGEKQARDEMNNLIELISGEVAA